MSRSKSPCNSTFLKIVRFHHQFGIFNKILTFSRQFYIYTNILWWANIEFALQISSLFGCLTPKVHTSKEGVSAVSFDPILMGTEPNQIPMEILKMGQLVPYSTIELNQSVSIRSGQILYIENYKNKIRNYLSIFDKSRV